MANLAPLDPLTKMVILASKRSGLRVEDAAREVGISTEEADRLLASIHTSGDVLAYAIRQFYDVRVEGGVIHATGRKKPAPPEVSFTRDEAIALCIAAEIGALGSDGHGKGADIKPETVARLRSWLGIDGCLVVDREVRKLRAGAYRGDPH
jgi:hypothetical protein